MAKSNSDNLFQLIKTLTKAEKRYFKLYVSDSKSEKSPKFLRLFNIIDKLSYYNEEKVFAKMSKTKNGQLSNIKAHLYKQILQSLRDHNSENDIEIKIREQIDHATLLYNRCLYDQCYKILDKVKKIAEEYEKTALMLNIITLEKKLMLKFIKTNIDDKITKLLEKTETSYDNYGKVMNFSNLYLKLYVFYTKIGYIRNNKDFEIVNNFLYSTMPTFDKKKLSVYENILHCSTLTGYYFFIQDFERAYEYAKQWVGLFEENPKYIVPKIEIYIRALNNLMVAQSKLSRYDEYNDSLSKYDAVYDIEDLNITPNIELLLFKNSTTHKINKYFLLGEFTEGCKIIPETADKLEKYSGKLNTHYMIIFYHKFASMYFGNEEYKKSVHWLSKIINMKDMRLRGDILGFARIMILICYYEMDDTDMVDYYIRSTYRFLRKKEDMHLFQNIIMKFLRKLNEIKTFELREAFIDLKEQLLPLTTNPYEKRAFLYFDIISWLESKIENRTVQEIIKEKSMKRINSYR